MGAMSVFELCRNPHHGFITKGASTKAIGASGQRLGHSEHQRTNPSGFLRSLSFQMHHSELRSSRSGVPFPSLRPGNPSPRQDAMPEPAWSSACRTRSVQLPRPRADVPPARISARCAAAYRSSQRPSSCLSTASRTLPVPHHPSWHTTSWMPTPWLGALHGVAWENTAHSRISAIEVRPKPGDQEELGHRRQELLSLFLAFGSYRTRLF